MFNICDLLKDNYDYNDQNNRFLRVRSSNVGLSVIKYLKDRLKYLDIEILTKQAGNILNLMENGSLEGWCWETTESAIVFFKDDDYIERGDLLFTNKKKYFHSWICFIYGGIEYVFDPCLNILCEKEIYHKVFEVDVQGRVSSKQVQEEMIRQIQEPKKDDNSEIMKFTKYLEGLLGDNSRIKGEVVCHGKEDINHPLFRNGVGYKANIEGNKIKSLVAHYYLNA